jgi:AcrR family transcriptional regulator
MEKEPGSSTPKRRYDATRRQAEARERQRRVVLAATELFLEQGYGGTSIDQIARSAGVSPQSVYATFESKAGILEQAVTLARTGDEAGSLRRSEDAAAILAEPDLAARCRLVARMLRKAYERSARLIALVVRASATDPALAELLTGLRAARRESVAALMADVPTSRFRGGLRPRDKAIDAMSIVVDGLVYDELVEGFGWTPAAYERWLADTLFQMCFAE